MYQLVSEVSCGIDDAVLLALITSESRMLTGLLRCLGSVRHTEVNVGQLQTIQIPT